MALIKEPYGLVYNTDGSLCTTVRDDDIPFPGVRSFAVEEATTNYCDDPDPYYGASEPYYGSEEDNVWIEEEGYYGTKCDIQWRDLGHGRYTVQEGDIITCSFEAKLYNGTVDHTILIFTNYGTAAWAELLSRRRINLSTGEEVADTYKLPNDGTWYRFVFTFVPRTPVTSWKIENSTVDPGAYVLHRKVQFEVKPYPTSFVDGSRPSGRLKVGIDDLRDGRLYNHVLSFWFKVPPISTYELENWPGKVGIVGNRVSPDYWAYSDYGMFIQSNGSLNFSFMHNPEGTRSQSLPSIPKEDYVNKWNNIIITFDEDSDLVRHVKVYFNGEYHGYADITRMDNYERTPDTFYFYNNYLRSHLLANIFIGKYKRTDGTVIWTDDYIREVYEAKIPFPVQSQLSIF